MVTKEGKRTNIDSYHLVLVSQPNFSHLLTLHTFAPTKSVLVSLLHA
jgi:hypothetical protein